MEEVSLHTELVETFLYVRNDKLIPQMMPLNNAYNVLYDIIIDNYGGRIVIFFHKLKYIGDSHRHRLVK